VDVQSHLDDDPEPERPREDQQHLHLPSSDDLRRLADAVRGTLRYRGIDRAEIEVAVVDDRQIREVNRTHLDHDWETDVISFTYHPSQPTSPAGDCGVLRGELIVSWETAQRTAAGTGWPAATELLLYAVHGALHLSGMDDHDEADRRQMRAAEWAVLEMLRPPGYARYDVDRETGSPATPVPSADRRGAAGESAP
jgi:probable rRNA maturation factor